VTSTARLAELDCGFRASYLDYDTLTRQLQRWADAFPHLCRLRALGATTEGRSIWHLTLGPDPDRIRPAVWVDAYARLGLAGSASRWRSPGTCCGASSQADRKAARACASTRSAVPRRAADVARRRRVRADHEPLRRSAPRDAVPTARRRAGSAATSTATAAAS
jgi:hypothetical protein